MSSTILWRGDSASVAQVDTLTISGTVGATDVYALTVNNKVLSVLANTTVAATAAQNIVAAWNALLASAAPEFAEMTAAYTTGGSLTITADTAGKPFTLSIGVTGTSTFAQVHTTASSGPADVSVAANYSGGVLPTNGDTLIFQNTANPALYGLSSLSAITLASLQVFQSFTGTIGLPRNSGSGSTSYLEYRPQYFQIGATQVILGFGAGSGSGRIKLDFGSVQMTTQIFNAGSQAENSIPAILLKGTHASNALTVLKATVGVAYFAGEVSTLATLSMGYVTSVNGDASIYCGSGTTLTIVTQAGGRLTVWSNVTTLVQYNGTVAVEGAATLGTATIGGTLLDQSTGTITTLTLLGKGVYDHSNSLTAKTITTFTMNTGAVYSDPYHVVTLTNGILLSGCRPEDVTINLPPGRTLSVS